MSNLNAGFLILNEWVPAFEALPADEAKHLLLSLIYRQRDGTPLPDFGDSMAGVFAQMIEPTIKRRLDGQSGGIKGTKAVPHQVPTIGTTQVPPQVTSEGRKEKKSIEELNNTLSDERVPRARTKKFMPPTVEEVRKYCEERGNNVDPERFVDHYTANGWKVGKNPMKDWKAAVRNWEKSEGAFTRSKERGNGVSADGNPGSFDTDEFFDAALRRSYGTSEVTNGNA